MLEEFRLEEDNTNEIHCRRRRSPPLLLIVCLNSQTSEFAAKATSSSSSSSNFNFNADEEFFIISL